MRKIIVLLLFICSQLSFGQEVRAGKPWSLQANIERNNVVEIAKPEQELINYYQSFPNSASILINYPISFTNLAQTSILPNGDKILKLTIYSKDAHALNLYYNNFHLPEKGKLFIYNNQEVKGAYTALNNSASNLFVTEELTGNAITLEYNQPFGSPTPTIEINQIGYFFRETNGTDASQACEVNVNCSEGNNWQDEKKGVVRLLIKDGSSTWWCSGSLVNNTDTDCKPYILSAEHCIEGTSSADNLQSIVYFNHESTTCEGSSSTGTQSLTGFTLKAKGPFSGGSDFALVELSNEVPENYNPYFNGWDITNGSYSSGVSIHHPSADIKKISTYNSALTTITLNGGLAAAYHGVVWSATSNGHGITEEGSSGSPIFNSEGLIIGTLTGGNSFCNKTSETDYYGKLFYHWDKNGESDNQKLSTWLDPSATGIQQLKGTYRPCTNSIVTPNFQSFKLYPNPADNLINIEFSSYESIQPVVRLTDLLGQEVMRMDLTNNTSFNLVINTNSLAAGNYILAISTSGINRYERVTISR